VRIGDHEYHPGEPACHKRAPASEPAGRILAGGDLDAEDLAVALSIHPSDDEHVDVDGPASLSYLNHQGIRPDDRVGAGIQGTVAKGLHLRIEAVGHLARSGTSTAS